MMRGTCVENVEKGAPAHKYDEGRWNTKTKGSESGKGRILCEIKNNDSVEMHRSLYNDTTLDPFFQFHFFLMLQG